MKDAIGGSMLLYIVVFFVSIIIVFFVSVLSFSKAYKVKNRIIEVIEEHGEYNADVAENLVDDMNRAGYLVANSEQISNRCGAGNLSNDASHLYCVYKKDLEDEDSFVYSVVTYIHFDIPIIGDRLTFSVKGETKTLGKNYDY